MAVLVTVGFRSRGEVFFVVYDSKITAMNAPGGNVYRYTHHKTEATMLLAKALAPKRSGRLAGGIRKDVRQTSRDRVVGRVRSTARHSTWVHEGTHGPIVPTSGTYMRLRPGGGYGFSMRKVVRGQSANPFLERAMAVTMVGSFPSPIGPANPFV
jgi:hypothetical protein